MNANDVTRMLLLADQVCTLERELAASGAIDDYRDEVPEAFAVYDPYGDAREIRCFLEDDQQANAEERRLALDSLVNRYKLYLAGFPGILTTDRVHEVKMKKSGVVIKSTAKPIPIVGIERIQDKLTILKLREVR